MAVAHSGLLSERLRPVIRVRDGGFRHSPLTVTVEYDQSTHTALRPSGILRYDIKWHSGTRTGESRTGSHLVGPGAASSITLPDLGNGFAEVSFTFTPSAAHADLSASATLFYVDGEINSLRNEAASGPLSLASSAQEATPCNSCALVQAHGPLLVAAALCASLWGLLYLRHKEGDAA